MARFTSVRAFDFDELVSSLFEPFGDGVGDVRQSQGVKSPFGPKTVYSDSFSLQDPSTGEGLIFAGNGFAVQGNANYNGPLVGSFTGGTVQAIFGFDGFDKGIPLVFAALEGISVAATKLQEVARTDSLTDDLNLLKSILSGADTFDLQSSNADLVRGFGGNDIIRTNGGADQLWGGDGSDTLLGGGGDDTLRGEAGRDVLTAGSGRDVLVGGRGMDSLIGGTEAGRDMFVFQSRADSATAATSTPFLNIDVIQNFTRGGSATDAAGDRINLDAIDANADVSGNQDFLWGKASAKAYHAWVKDVGADVLLLADVTGDTTADFAIRLKNVALLAEWNVIL